MSQAREITIDQPRDIAPANEPASEANAIIHMIERAARDPNVDIDKFERLMAMKERVEADLAQKAFNVAMSEAQSEMPQVLRSALNTHTKSKYARLEDVLKSITPVITKHGFSMSFDTEDSPLKDHYRVTCVVAHKAGHFRKHHADLPADTAGSQGKANKTALQGFGSTASYGRRYLTLLIFNIALTNEDNDGNNVQQEAASDEVVSPEQVEKLREALKFRGGHEQRFLDHIKVDCLENILASKFDACLRIINGVRK